VEDDARPVVAFAALLAFTLFYERDQDERGCLARPTGLRFEEKEVRSIRIVRPDGAVRLERLEGDHGR
jgi:hypothetical protein